MTGLQKDDFHVGILLRMIYKVFDDIIMIHESIAIWQGLPASRGRA